MNRPCEPLQSVAGTATWCGQPRFDRGGSQLAFPAAHGASPLTQCSQFVLLALPYVNASEHSKKSEAETAALLEAEIDARLCALR
jgi:hypothetical protein